MSMLWWISWPGECVQCTNKPRVFSKTGSAPKPLPKMRLALCAASLRMNLHLLKNLEPKSGCQEHSSLAEVSSLLAESTEMASVMVHM
jgi:hypothetical protein